MRNALPILALVAAVALAATSRHAEPVPPVVVVTGPRSLVEDPGRHRVTTADAWAALWTEHAGEPARRSAHFLDVDFERYEVVAFFLGPSQNTRGVRDLALVDGDRERRLRFRHASYQTMDVIDETVPFAFVVIPRREVPLVLVEDVRHLGQQEPVWREGETLAPAAR